MNDDYDPEYTEEPSRTEIFLAACLFGALAALSIVMGWIAWMRRKL